MIAQAPVIDQRNAEGITTKVKDLLALYAPEWKEYDPLTGKPKGMSAALIGVFARFCEIIIQRLNQVPQKNFLAFLDMLGSSLLPPQPSRVPLTFFLAAGSTDAAVVPAGTQVAAPPAEGEKDPVIFETERELSVTPAQLTSIFICEPEKDLYADQSMIIASPVRQGVPVFQGNKRIDHVLYLGHNRLLGFPHMKNVSLTLTLSSTIQNAEARDLRWESWDGTSWREKTLSSNDDGTKDLTKTGVVNLGGMEPVPDSMVGSVRSRWIRCRLVTPVTRETKHKSGMVRESQLPSLTAITMQVVLDNQGLAVENAFTNRLPVDLTKSFFPFGEKPRFGDALYLANKEALSQAGVTAVLHIDLDNPIGKTKSPIAVTSVYDDLQLTWEYWDGQKWSAIGIATAAADSMKAGFGDTTRAFTKPGDVTLFLSEKPGLLTINGIESYWIRVRITSGNYGKEAYYSLKTAKPEDGYILNPATFAPPSISSIAVDYSVTIPNEAPEAVIAFNDLEHEDVTLVLADPNKSLVPFRATKDTAAGLYYGFVLPSERMPFPNRTVSLYNRVAERVYAEKSIPWSPDFSSRSGDPESQVIHTFEITNPAAQKDSIALDVLGTTWSAEVIPGKVELGPGETREVQVKVTIPAAADAPLGSSDCGFVKLVLTSCPAVEYHAVFTTWSGARSVPSDRPSLAWEYWNGVNWQDISARDESENFTRPGVLEFLPPKDFCARRKFGLERFWLRGQWRSGEYPFAPRLQCVLLNTTIAVQNVSVRNETLGSSDQSEAQKFQTTRNPILEGQKLEVREPEMPFADEQAIVKRDEGENAISVLPDVAGRSPEIWVRWHEVPDFYGSGPRDRHYMIDHLTGAIAFGDGSNGMIPPRGSGNIRLAQYQTGGGVCGNKPTGAITQLKTTVPYVEKVINQEPSIGGADSESIESLHERAPRTIRHGNRSVTLEDYEDLAILASPEVARARCIPLRNLSGDPIGDDVAPGEVSVIIVPRSKDAKPLPSLELIAGVQKYLVDNGIPTANVSVVGALYVRVDVTVEVALSSLEGASTVELAVRGKLERFLHPLTGGLDGKGWDFGREPYKSDLYALIGSTPGVDHVPSLALDDSAEDPTGAIKRTGRFLVYSGIHRINLVFE